MQALRQTVVKAADIVTDVTDGVLRVKSGHKVSLSDGELALVPEGFHQGSAFPDWLFSECPSSDKERRRAIAEQQINALQQAPQNRERMSNFFKQYPGSKVRSSAIVAEGKLAVIDQEGRKTQAKVWLFDKQLAWSFNFGTIDAAFNLNEIIVRMTNRDPHEWFLTPIDRSNSPWRISCMTKNETKDWLNYVWLCQIALGLDTKKEASSTGATTSPSTNAASTNTTPTTQGTSLTTLSGQQKSSSQRQQILQSQQMQMQQQQKMQQQQQAAKQSMAMRSKSGRLPPPPPFMPKSST